ncbi:MAG: hypothetical protein ACOCP4_04510 [Candidatus Woesearchaeota archaeon]
MTWGKLEYSKKSIFKLSHNDLVKKVATHKTTFYEIPEDKVK